MYEKKQKTAAAAEKVRGTAQPAAANAGLSNSALTAMLLPGEERTGFLRPELVERFNAPLVRSAEQNQIPAAEDEADRLSAGVTAGSSPESVKAAMGERLGADFSGVSFHTDAGAADRADAMGARAYTSGSDVFFGSGGFDPAIAAHELVHTVQQGAVAGGVQTVSAPAASVQMWSWGRKKKAAKTPSAAPKQITFEGMEELKKGKDSQGMAVAKVAGAGEAAGSTGVVKTGVSLNLETALSGFFNEAGRTYGEKLGGDWSFSTPEVRPLNQAERTAATPLVQRGALRSAKGNPTEAQELNGMAVFGLAGGESPANPFQFSDEEVAAETKRRAKDKDYGRMMGYINMMDAVLGNEDRLVHLNPDNWMEDERGKHVDLIDNDFQSEAMIPMGLHGRSNWLRSLGNFVQPGDAEGTAKALYERTLGNSDLSGIYLGDAKQANAGAAQAIADLPGMRDRLKAQYYQTNKQAGGSGKLTEEQEEVLERMQIMHEYATNPEMARIYQQLADPMIGFGTRQIWVGQSGQEKLQEVQESDEIKQHRANLLAQRDALRYGGNTGGAKPTATAGPGWTRGSAQDWMNAGRPPAPAAAPAASIGTHRRRRKPLDLSLDND